MKLNSCAECTNKYKSILRSQHALVSNINKLKDEDLHRILRDQQKIYESQSSKNVQMPTLPFHILCILFSLNIHIHHLRTQHRRIEQEFWITSIMNIPSCLKCCIMNELLLGWTSLGKELVGTWICVVYCHTLYYLWLCIHVPGFVEDRWQVIK